MHSTADLGRIEVRLYCYIDGQLKPFRVGQKCKRNGGLPNLFGQSSCLLNLMMNLLMMKDVMVVIIKKIIWRMKNDMR